MPRRPQFHPHPHPPPRRHPCFKNRTSHVTATQRVSATPRNEYWAPRYVPPALCNNIETLYRSQHTQSTRSNSWMLVRKLQNYESRMGSVDIQGNLATLNCTCLIA